MASCQGRNGEASASFKTVRVLVVEDEIDDARFALDTIEDLGVEVDVEVTPYGERALELLMDRVFDCVLLDYRLPRMDGDEFVRRLRDRGVETPVVVLTGRGSEEIADDLLAAGADAYIDKDDGDERLRSAVSEALDAA